MNTTLRYWLPSECRCRYVSFKKYSEAIEMIRMYNTIGVKSEVVGK